MCKKTMFALLFIIAIIFIVVAGFRIYWYVQSSTDLLNNLNYNFKKARGEIEFILLMKKAIKGLSGNTEI